MGIQINGQNDTISASDGSLSVSGYELTTFTNIDSTGIITAATFSGNIIGVAATFTGNVSVGGTLTYLDVTNVDSVGLITARSGILLTGGNVTLGTGVTASGVTANTFTLSTNSSERLRVDSSGNIDVDSGGMFYDATNNRLGIGTTSPGALLEAKGAVRLGNQSNGDDTTTINSTNGVYIGVNHDTTTTTVVPLQIGGYPAAPGYSGTPDHAIVFNGWSGSTIYHNAIVNRKGRELSFHTAITGNGFSDTNERARIDSSGRLGIGTSSPGQALHVVGKGRFQEAASSGAIAFIGGDATAAYIDTGTYASNQPLAFRIEGTERARIDSAGRVGIGTTSPTANRKLTLKSGGGDAGLSIVNTADDIVGLIVPENTTTSQELGIYSLSNMRLYTGGTQKATIDTSGRLLVGTSTSIASDSKLQVKDGAIHIYHANSTASAGYDLRFSTDGGATARTQAAIGCLQATTNQSGGILTFSTTADGASSPTEHYRISQGGNLIITSNVGLYNLRQTTYNGNSNAVLGVFGSYNGDAVDNGAVYNIEWKMNGNASGQFWYANYITQGGSRTLGAYCTGTAWTNSSDIANKEEIVDTRYGLDTVLSLRPVDFRWKSQRDENGNGKPDIGFIAQEMEQIIPEVVTGAEGNKGISYGNLVSVLAKAIQEQQAMIAELQAEVAALKAA